MSVKIGHASIGEDGKARGGQAGDQTGKEVCTRNWYKNGWTVLLRPDAQYADKMARACEAGCANAGIGYDMNQRNTLHTEAQKYDYNLSRVGTCETDCSAFMTVCAIAGGVKELEYTGNAPTTHTMRKVFRSTGKFTMLTDKKYLDSDEYLLRGDILVKEGSHTVMVLSNGSKAVPTPSDLDGKDIRTVSALNLNARVQKMGTVLFVLNAGEMVNVVEEKDGWCKVEAWVSSKYLVK